MFLTRAVAGSLDLANLGTSLKYVNSDGQIVKTVFIYCRMANISYNELHIKC